MARTLPVDGWSTTTAPSLLAPGGSVVRACSAAFCSDGSTVSVTLSVVQRLLLPEEQLAQRLRRLLMRAEERVVLLLYAGRPVDTATSHTP